MSGSMICGSAHQSSLFNSLQTKGLSNMIELIALIALAGAYSGILEKYRILEAYMQKLLGETSTSLLSATVRTLGLGLVSCT
jgi:Na+:H+ antiporter, NhaC family